MRFPEETTSPSPRPQSAHHCLLLESSPGSAALTQPFSEQSCRGCPRGLCFGLPPWRCPWLGPALVHGLLFPTSLNQPHQLQGLTSSKTSSGHCSLWCSCICPLPGLVSFATPLAITQIATWFEYLLKDTRMGILYTFLLNHHNRLG